MNKHVFCNAHWDKEGATNFNIQEGGVFHIRMQLLLLYLLYNEITNCITTLKVEISKLFNHLFQLPYVRFINVTENGFRLANTNKQPCGCLFILFDCFSTYINGAFYLVIVNMMQCKRTSSSSSSFYHHVCRTDNSIAVCLNNVRTFNVKLNLCETFE